MSTDQDWVYEALRHRLDTLEGPCPWRPRWWEFALKKRERYVQQVLREAGLPPLTDDGRVRYYASGPQGYDDAMGYWSRRWCAALGLEWPDPFTGEMHPAL